MALETAEAPAAVARLAEMYLRSGRGPEAAAQLEALRKIDPSNPMTHYLLGVVAMEEQQYERARNNYERVLLLNPGFEPAYADLAVAFLSLERPADAVAILERARRDCAPSFRVEFLLGAANAVMTRFDESFARYQAAEAMGTPIYLHPNAMPAKMIQHFIEAGLDGAIYGFGVETGLHALRLMTSGVFDRFPKLQIVLGHMGEALPFWSYRLDYMHRATVNSKRYPSMGPVKRKPSEYLRENFHITNSGVASEAAIKFTQDLVGVDRVLYAMDYPYQYAVDEVRILDAMNMSDDVKMKFFQTNAERLFGIPPAK
jgi:predicted TIM-barrel fold metal-dependent hydrolase